MRLPSLPILIAVLSTQLAACVPIIAGGAATGGLAASDRRTSGAYVEDELIEWKAQNRVRDALGEKIHLNVTSFNRNVLMTGEAIDEATRKKTANIVREVENVRNVTDEIIIGGASSLTSRSNDAYLTARVKGRMISENRFQPNHVKVFTENAVVYLMGMVTRKEADDAVDIARNTDGVQKVVKVFEYIVE